MSLQNARALFAVSPGFFVGVSNFTSNKTILSSLSNVSEKETSPEAALTPRTTSVVCPG